ncbi:hypothetical protein [Cystobacter ferrugineus]|nr:hypothetical protein [Cystobacter ferrugineus]
MSTENPFLFGPKAEGKKPHTYTRSLKSKNHGEKFNPFLEEDRTGQVIAANVGGFTNFLEQFNRAPDEIDPSFTQEKERWRGTGVLYEQLRTYSLSRCDLLVKKVKAKLQQHGKLVYFLNNYPCVHVDLTDYSKALVMNTKGEREAFSEYMCFILNAYIDSFAHKEGFTLSCVCRSSFGFLVPTTAPTVDSIRISLGLAPESYLTCVTSALALMFKHLDDLKKTAATTIPSQSFFARTEHKDYLEKKENQRLERARLAMQEKLKKAKDEKKKTSAKPIKKRNLFFYDKKSSLGAHMKNKISSQKGLMQEVTRKFGGGSLASETCYKALAQSKNGVREALLAALSSKRWAINDQGSSTANNNEDEIDSDDDDLMSGVQLSFVEPQYQRYSDSDIQLEHNASSLADMRFQEMALAIILAAGMVVENKFLSQDALWRATLFAAEDIYRQGITIYRKRKGEEEAYEDGSDSEEEDEELYHCKLISQNGMNAIGLALAFSKLWRKECAITDEPRIFMEEMYFEAPNLLKVNKWLTRTTDDQESNILLGDVNHCVTSIKEKSDKLISGQDWEDKTVVIVDVTSATLAEMGRLVRKFEQEEPQVLVLVSSGLKHEQLGTDKNAYGTVRFFVNSDRKDTLQKVFASLKTHPAYRKQPIVSHSVRRMFKSVGAVPTISAILAKRPAPATKGSQTTASSFKQHK